MSDTPRLERVDWIVVHHSVTPPDWTLADIDRMHAARNFRWRLGERSGSVGYHRLVFADGTVQEGRPLELQGAHVGPHRIAGQHWPGLNACSIGVCFVGDFTEHGWTFAQALAGLDEIERLCRRFGLSAEQVQGHGEYPGAATACPGAQICMTAIRVELAHRLRSP